MPDWLFGPTSIETEAGPSIIVETVELAGLPPTKSATIQVTGAASNDFFIMVPSYGISFFQTNKLN